MFLWETFSLFIILFIFDMRARFCFSQKQQTMESITKDTWSNLPTRVALGSEPLDKEIE